MSDFVSASHVFFDCPATTVDEALAYLAGKAVELDAADDVAALTDALKAREAEGTTGMMGGFAIPHAKSAAVKEATVVVAVFSQGIEWNSMDGEPIKVAICLLSPEGAAAEHLKPLSRVAVLLMDPAFRTKVLDATDGVSIVEAISEGLAK